MRLRVYDIAVEAITELPSIVETIRRHDRSLADQLKRAGQSVVLNIAEGEYSDPGTARARFNNAAGSANEVRGALRVAAVWGYVPEHRTAKADAKFDTVQRMLSPLTGPRRR